MALQMVSIPGAKIGKRSGVGRAIAGAAQLYSNLPSDTKEDIYRWFTESEDERDRRESNEEAYENYQTAARNAGLSGNPNDWVYAKPDIPTEPTKGEQPNKTANDAPADEVSDYDVYKKGGDHPDEEAVEVAAPEEEGDLAWVTEPTNSPLVYIMEA